MPHSVQIPKARVPSFPDRCVQCGADAPGATFDLKSTASANKPLREPLGKSWTAQIPCCEPCKLALRRGKWFGRIVFGGAIGAALLILWLASTLWPASLDSWVGYVVVLAAVAIPLVIGQAIFTPAVEFTPWDDRLVFDFRDRAYAEQFAELNDAKLK